MNMLLLSQRLSMLLGGAEVDFIQDRNEDNGRLVLRLHIFGDRIIPIPLTEKQTEKILDTLIDMMGNWSCVLHDMRGE